MSAYSYYWRGLYHGWRRSSRKTGPAELKLAIAYLTEAIKLDPDFYDAYVSRGAGYEQLDQYGCALADYRKLIELKPDICESYGLHAKLCFWLAYYPDAIKSYTKMIELSGGDEHGDYLPYRARAYRELGDQKRALEDYDELLRIAPKHSWALLGRARIYEQRGEVEKAIADYQRYLALEEASPVLYVQERLAALLSARTNTSRRAS
jgi:tetratricopeptide (TPR) repeat protein